MKNNTKNILLIIAQDGYQTKEFGDAKHVLENAGYKVTTASMKEGEVVSNVGEHIIADAAVKNIDPSKFDAMFIIGGPGALRSLDNDDVKSLFARFANETKNPYGAICISSRILAGAGVLKGAKATGWNADRKLGDILKNSGAAYVEEPVVVDGRVITADGPGSAASWGESIAKMLAVS